MWRNVGIQRDAEGLQHAAQQVDFWDRYVSQREFSDLEGWQLQNMLLVARLMIAAAAARTESRGVHFRSDFPQSDAHLAQHIVINTASIGRKQRSSLVPFQRNPAQDGQGIC